MLRRIPVYKALNKTNLTLGGERNLVLMVGLICFTLVFAAHSWPLFIIGLSTWFVSIALLRKMANEDPKMSKVYLKHIKHQKIYEPFSRPWRKK